MTQRGKSESRSWRKVAAAYVVAVPAITAIVVIARWPPLIGLLGLPVGALITWRWQP